MGSVVEEKLKTGALANGGGHPTLLEEMKLLKEMQDQSGLFFFIKTSTVSLLCLFLKICLLLFVRMRQLSFGF